MHQIERQSRLRAVILDVDGTLIDSNDAHAEAWKQAGADYGRRIPFHAARALIGMGGDKVLQRLTGLDAEDPEGKQIKQRRVEIFTQRYLPGLQPFSAARELLVHLRKTGVKLVPASSAESKELDALLERAGIRDLVAESPPHHSAESKPDPDIVELALEQAGVSPDQA